MSFRDKLIERGYPEDAIDAHDCLSDDELAALPAATLEHIASIYEFKIKAAEQSLEGAVLETGSIEDERDLARLQVLNEERLAYIRGLLSRTTH